MSPLKPLYALAIALLVVAFVGFGISAFYQEPQYPAYPSGMEGPEEELSPEEKREMQVYREKERAYREAYSDYNLVVACVSVGIAVLLLVGSVVRMGSLPVIGEGTTLGAVFVLFYGLIRAFMTNDEQIRFGAVAVGLAILLALVYWKFSRSGGGSPVGGEAPNSPS
jgi:hypothetical protein